MKDYSADRFNVWLSILTVYLTYLYLLYCLIICIYLYSRGVHILSVAFPALDRARSKVSILAKLHIFSCKSLCSWLVLTCNKMITKSVIEQIHCRAVFLEESTFWTFATNFRSAYQYSYMPDLCRRPRDLGVNQHLKILSYKLTI